jgi:DNA modification methylase
VVHFPERLETVAVVSLRSHDRNARTHSRAQIEQIRRSIERFGFTNPVLADASNTIIAGHGRVAAAKLLHLDRVPVLRLEHLSKAERRAYVIADNRLAELAGWDKELLQLELGAILAVDAGFDLALTGFDGGELEALLNASDTPALDADAAPEVERDDPAITGRGDMWLLGNHRLLCGDARDAGAYATLLGDDRAQVVVTDPPYNVPVNGHVCGLGKVKHREFAMASGEMTEAEFIDFLTNVCRQLATFSVDGSIHFVCMDWRHMREMLTAGHAAYAELKNLIVWNKDNGGMGAFYRSKHELIFAFKNGTAPHINNFELGQHGRYRTNVWDYAGINSMRVGRDEELAMHPTVKPVAMIADAIRDCSKRRGIVLDAFSGSGTTIMACEETGRWGRALEIDPHYVDVAVRRWQKATGKSAMLAGTEATFDEVASTLA